MTLNVKHVEERNQYEVAVQVALATTYFLLTILATVGNLCVFVINFRWRGGISNFKITSIFLLNLAVTDLGIAVGNLPFAFISICLNKWVFGEVFCVINGFIAIYLPTVSIMTILIITVHRALVVLYPFKTFVTKKLAYAACALSWIWSLVVPIPPLFGVSNYEYNADRGFCRIDWMAKGAGAEFYSIISVTLFVIVPLCLITILNFILLLTSWKLQLSAPQPSIFQSSNFRRKSTVMADQKAFKTVTLVVGAFILCWLPQVITTLLGIVMKEKLRIPREIGTFRAVLVMANSTMNPFIYTYVNKDFRARFVQILLCSTVKTVQRLSMSRANSVHHSELRKNISRTNLTSSVNFEAEQTRVLLRSDTR